MAVMRSRYRRLIPFLSVLLLGLLFSPSGQAQTAPVITTQPQSQTVNTGASPAFAVTASGSLPLFYQWFHDGILLSGATSATLSLASVTTAQAGVYTVAVSNSVGGVTSNPATLTVIPLPEITSPLLPNGYTVGVPFRYRITATNSASSFNATGLPPGLTLDTATGVISGIPTSSGTYAVTMAATNAVGTGAAVTLNLVVGKPSIVLARLVGITGPGSGIDTAAHLGAPRFNLPDGLGVDGNGNLYVADTGNHTIRKVTADGIVTTIAGGDGQPGYADGPGGSARFNTPTGIAVDATGNVYVADTANQLIRKVTPTGVVSTLGGVYGQIGGNDGIGASARFNSPRGIAIDGSGNVIVADTGNGTVRKITPTGMVVTLAGAVGQTGNTDGPGASARFANPSSVAVDAAGNVYVLDTDNFSIRKITASGTVSTIVSQLYTTTVSGNTTLTGTLPAIRLAADGVGHLFVTMGPTIQPKPNNPYSVPGIASYEMRELNAPDDDNPLTQTWEALSGIGAPTGITADGRGRVYMVSAAGFFTIGPAQGAVILAQPQGKNAAPGQTVSFSVTADGFPSPNAFFLNHGSFIPVLSQYQWQENGVDIPINTNGTARSPTLTVTAGTADAVYTVVVSSAAGSVVSAPATLTVGIPSGAAPVIATQPQSVAATVGSTTTLTVAAADSSPVAYQWRKNGVDLAGATGASLVLKNIGPGDVAAYTVVLSRSGGSTVSNPATLSLITLPGIITQPQNQIATTGGSVTFSVTTSGTGPLAYQWYRNGVPINLATAATYTIAAAGTSDAGAYSVLVSNQGGVVASSTAVLSVSDVSTRLRALSVRSLAGTNANTLIAGVALSGTSLKTLVMRGVGPALGQFGVSGFLVDPRLTVFADSGQAIQSNDDWGGNTVVASTFTSVGLPSLPVDSKDSALLLTAAPGIYTVQLTSSSGTGIGLLELYDTGSMADGSRLSALSVRGAVGTGANVLIVGFVVGGNGPERVVIRGLGPGLAASGVPGVLTDPQLQLFDNSGLQIGANDDWGGGNALAGAFAAVGLTALPANSKDAALLVTLQPGIYTVQLSGVSNGTGVGLIELYEAP